MSTDKKMAVRAAYLRETSVKLTEPTMIKGVKGIETMEWVPGFLIVRSRFGAQIETHAVPASNIKDSVLDLEPEKKPEKH